MVNQNRKVIIKNLVSIVVPIFNAELYLKKCVESIINQAYKNIELILVNDGSTDDTVRICDKYSEIDKRIKVIHKKNAGPGIARHDGIYSANGEYILFVDADDYIDNNMIEKLVKEMDEGFDIVQFGYRKVSVKGNILTTVRMKAQVINGSYESALYYSIQENTSNFLWNKIYRKEIFEKVSFPNLYAGEDSCILTQLYTYSKKIKNIKEVFYSYVMSPESLCRQKFNEKKLDNVEAGKFMYNFHVKNYKNLCVFSALYVCSYTAKLYCEISNSDISNKRNKKNELKKEFNIYYKLYKKDNLKSLKYEVLKRKKLFVEVFNKSTYLGKLLLKTLKNKN